jgi:hypothetical protein
MTELRQRMIECLQLRGLSERTQETYVRAVRQLSEHYHKSPYSLTEEELRKYFLYLKNVRQALLPQHVHHRHLRHQVLLRTDAAKKLGHLQPVARAARKEAARHPQRRRSTSDSQSHQQCDIRG